MSLILSKVSETLLAQLEGYNDQQKWEGCARQFPWYPITWVMLAGKAGSKGKGAKQKAALWFQDEQRLHWLLNAEPWQHNSWLKEKLKELDEEDNREESEEEERFEKAGPVVQEENLLIEASSQTAFIKTEAGEVSQESTSPIQQQVDDLPLTADDIPSPVAFQDGEVENKFEEVYPASEDTVETIAEEAFATVFIQESDPAPIAQQADNLPVVKERESIHDQDNNPYGISTPIEEIVTPLQPQTNEEAADGFVTIPQGTTPIHKHHEPPAESVQDTLEFQPYYSVDYFASQGIKVDTAAEPQNKFDRQLKSFTQWLKTMKKVNLQESVSATDPEVEAQANASVSEKEIITEAMAEVLQKQGKHEKALEIFEKLILLHPEKSAFFAARIQELKDKQ